MQWQQQHGITGTIAPTIFRCIVCGYDLSGAALGGVCAECGTPVQRSLPHPSGGRSSGIATSCMVVGIVSLAVCMILGPVAIFLYYRAIREMSAGGYAKASYTMAKAGLILGIISTCILGIYVLFIGGAALSGL